MYKHNKKIHQPCVYRKKSILKPGNGHFKNFKIRAASLPIRSYFIGGWQLLVNSTDKKLRGADLQKSDFLTQKLTVSLL